MLLRSDVLVGRGAELAALTLVLADAGSDGRARVVLVEGDGGVGKTRLVTDAVRRPPAGATVVWGAAYAGASDVPMLPWAEALRDLLRQWGSDVLAETAGSAAADFAVLLPELGEPTPGRPQRLADLMPWFWERLAAHAPLVVVLEDLHAADPASMAVLARLSRHGRGRLTLLVTGRPGGDARDPEGSTRWRDAAAELRRTEATVVALDPLGPAAAGELAGRLVSLHRAASAPSATAPVATPTAVSAAEVEELAAASRGVPYFLEQLAAAHLAGDRVAGLPGDPALASRAAMSPAAADLLAVLALHGGDMDHPLLTLVLSMQGWDDRAVAGALREAVAAGLVAADADDYRLSHALLAEQVRAELLLAERQQWHSRIAAGLRTRPDDARAVASLPAHCEACGDGSGALVASVRAGAMAAYAASVAARHFARAVALWGTVEDPETLTGTTYDDLVEQAATRFAQAGEVEAAVELARDWLDGEGPAHDPARASRMALLVAARGEWVLPEPEVAAAFEAAVRWADAAGGANLSAALTGQARHLAGLDRNDEAESLALRALSVADPSSPIEEAYARATLGAVLAHLGDHDGGVEQLRSALTGMHPLDDAQEHARTSFELVWTEFYAGRAEAARDLALATVQALGGAGLVLDIRASLQGAAAQIEVWLGHWDAASEVLEQGEREDPADLGRASRLLAHGELALRSGRVDAARELLAAYIGHWESRGLREYDHVGVAAAAEAAAAAGDLAAAHDLVQEALVNVARADTVYELSAVARAGAAVLTMTNSRGRPVAPELLVGLEQVLARVEACRRLSTTCVPYAELLTARAAVAAARNDASSPAWAAAAQAWRDIGFPWWENWCQLCYAEALLRSRGARGKAAEVLTAVRAAAGALPAAALVAAADQLAAAAGLQLAEQPTVPRPPEDGTPPQLAGLTEREREVLELLVEGLSNRAIAQRLFISEKTASVHVSNILGKLGVSSRLQAASLARASNVQ